MKKLLAILGAISIVASPSTVLISCAGAKIPEENSMAQKSLLALNEQIAKVAYLSDTQNYDINYLMKNFVKPSYVKDLTNKVDPKENLTEYDRYQKLFDRYYDQEFLSPNIKTNLNLNGNLKPTTLEGIIPQLVNLGPQIFDMLKGQGLAGMLTLVIQTGMLNSFLTPEMLGIIGSVLNKETLEAFKTAFDDSIYQGMTNQETLTSGMIGLTNALISFTGGTKTFDYKDKTKLAIDSDNYKDAMNEFGTIMAGIVNGTTKFNFDIINNLKGIEEIIRFVRLTLTYVEQFDPNASPTWTEIQNVRTGNYNVGSKLDVKKLITNLDIRLNSSGGEGIRSLIAILFQSHEKPRITSILSAIKPITDSSIPTEGLSALLLTFVNKYLLIPGIGSMNIYAGNFITEIIDIMSTKSSLSKIISVLNTAGSLGISLPEEFKTIFEKIKNDQNIINDVFKALYDGSLLETIFGTDSTIGKLKDIKTIISMPIKELLGPNSILNFVEDKSILTIVDDLTKNINGDILFKWQDFYNLFDSLLKPTTNDSWVLKDALENPDKLFEILGFKDGNIINNTPIYYLNEIISNLMGLKDVLKLLERYVSEFNVIQQKLLTTMKTTISDLKTRTLKQSTDNNFKYEINGKQITIIVSKNNEKYLINEITVI